MLVAQTRGTAWGGTAPVLRQGCSPPRPGGCAHSLLAPCCLSWEAQSSSGGTRGPLWAAHFQRAEVPWDCLGRVVGTKPPPSLLLVSFWAGPAVPSCSPDGQMSSEHPSFPFWMATTRISSAKTLLRAMLQLQAAAGLPVQVPVLSTAPLPQSLGLGAQRGLLTCAPAAALLGGV